VRSPLFGRRHPCHIPRGEVSGELLHPRLAAAFR